MSAEGVRCRHAGEEYARDPYSRRPAAKPIAARRPPARAPMLMAELDFDVLEVADDGLDPVPEGFSADVPEPEEDDGFDEGGTPEEEEALAVAWNAKNVLFCVGLMAKTMPCSQWAVWRQNHQVGVVSLTVSENEGTCVALAVTGWKPESAPVASGWHGAAKDDCETVWFFG